MNMVLYSVVVFSVLVVYSCGQTQPVNECKCMPHKFQAVVSGLKSVNAETFYVQELQVYFLVKRFVVRLYRHNSTSGESTYLKRIVTDYHKGKQYIFDSTNSSSCIVRDADTIGPPQCITDPGAHFMGTTYLGSILGSLYVDLWRFPLEGPKTAKTVTIAFADHLLTVEPACVPVFQTVSSATDPENGNVMMFSKFKPTVNITWFDITGCAP